MAEREEAESRGGCGGPAQSVTVKGTRQGGGRKVSEARRGEAHGSGGVRWDGGGKGKVHSENGGLILGADGSL